MSIARRLGAGGGALALVLIASPVAAQSPSESPLKGIVNLPPLNDLLATRERPLFAPDRRPPAPPAEPQQEVAETPAEPQVEEAELPFELAGVVLGPQVEFVIVRDRNSGESQRLKRGETVEEWSIDEISRHHVVFRREQRRVHLNLFEEKPADAERRTEADPDNPEPRASKPVARAMAAKEPMAKPATPAAVTPTSAPAAREPDPQPETAEPSEPGEPARPLVSPTRRPLSIDPAERARRRLGRSFQPQMVPNDPAPPRVVEPTPAPTSAAEPAPEKPFVSPIRRQLSLDPAERSRRRVIRSFQPE
jgi:general secretion pathway protein N